MKRTLLALAAAALPFSAAAQPPAPGTVHTFVDPLYYGTVFCDTLDQLRHIVESDQPQQIYLEYLATPNHVNEPTCAAIVPTGRVLEVERLGIMERDSSHYNAWAVKVQVGTVTVYGLYLTQMYIV